MSLHTQGDISNNLSPRYPSQIYLYTPVSDAIGLSVAEPDAIKAVPLGFTEDFLAEHSSSGEVPHRPVL